MEVLLNTGSTLEQGRIIKGGNKLTSQYKDECAICYINPGDFKLLNEPSRVKVKSGEGEVVVFARADDSLTEGEIFIPRGPWANAVISSYTYGTGSALYKGMKVGLEPSDKKVLECDELIKEYYL